MTPMRSMFLTALFCACAVFVPVAVAEPTPIFDGSMMFQSIQGPDGAEEFFWEMNLRPDQELHQIDDRHAGVYYTDPGTTLAFSIAAIAAHDAIGTTVPTTLAVIQPNVITLTVHHRAGNPAAGGAPFDYPVIAGDGWEGGIQIHQVQGPPEEVRVLAPVCTVPDLGGRTLRASRRLLHRAHCKLGRVRGERNRAAHVVQQYRLAGKSLPDWARVDVKVS